ncbi:hypothetical protein RR48_00575 [Papilio machaon]|uniref:Uncharacterized protein n=1 Tax=Papilio machaon TaxID=76193 RepID=A0A0N1IQN0_PAPMA|nr:hypothetical protein RR48_00575 [Papilio machaon]
MPGTSSHSTIRLSRKGMKRVSQHGYGDHYVHIKIQQAPTSRPHVTSSATVTRVSRPTSVPTQRPVAGLYTRKIARRKQRFDQRNG